MTISWLKHSYIINTTLRECTHSLSLSFCICFALWFQLHWPFVWSPWFTLWFDNQSHFHWFPLHFIGTSSSEVFLTNWNWNRLNGVWAAKKIDKNWPQTFLLVSILAPFEIRKHTKINFYRNFMMCSVVLFAHISNSSYIHLMLFETIEHAKPHP